MAPELLGYVPLVDPRNVEYTEAINLWALGCIIHRLATGVVPFPPDITPNLVQYCQNTSTLRLHQVPMSEFGLESLRELLAPHPARRVSAKDALTRTWASVG